MNCPIKVGNAIKTRELPHKLFIVAPISGEKNPPMKAPRVVNTTGTNSLSNLMVETEPELSIDVASHLGAKGSSGASVPGETGTLHLNVKFHTMDDFTPKGVERALAAAVPAFKEKLAALDKLTNFQAKLMNTKDLEGLDVDLEDPGLRDVLSRAQTNN
jgi:type VI secretion system ImpB/VipA family protein